MQQLQARQKQHEAEQQHNAIRNNEPSAILKLLEDRYLGKKRTPSRSCRSLLHYRYSRSNRHTLAEVSISEFTNFAHFLGRSQVLALTQDDDCFRKARQLFKDVGVRTSWSKQLGEWTKEHPLLATRFLEGMKGIRVGLEIGSDRSIEIQKALKLRTYAKTVTTTTQTDAIAPDSAVYAKSTSIATQVLSKCFVAVYPLKVLLDMAAERDSMAAERDSEHSFDFLTEARAYQSRQLERGRFRVRVSADLAKSNELYMTGMRQAPHEPPS